MKSAILVSFTLVVFSLQAATPEADLSSGLQTFTKVLDLVQQNFADEVSTDQAIYDGAVPGMLRTLDPHSGFLDPKAYQLLQQDQHGQYYGVGMYIGMDGRRAIVQQPFEGSPAYKAGIRRGDWIVAVDGKSVERLNSAEIADMLKGPLGTKVTVGIQRAGVDQKLSFPLNRGEIVHSNVSTVWAAPGIAYVHIANFSSQTTARDMEAGLKALGESNVTGLILDLRGNPGGLVNQAVAVAGHFLDKNQTVVSQRGRASAEEVYRVKTDNPNSRRYPVVVLVDKSSASASEIVAGALQDHDRAWIVGESTFGKGLVQGTYPLSEGTALMLVIAKYHTPSGRLIQRDYEHQSFFDYYSHADKDARNVQDVQKTDSGRTVYGGGGITPDEKYTAPQLTPLQIRILRPRYTFIHFASDYFGGGEPKLSKDWKPDAGIVKKFQDFLRQANITFTDKEFADNQDWISNQLRIEMYTRAFEWQNVDQITAQLDPEVQKGIRSLPKAQALLEDARRVLAQRH
jgi:carboxyl-terminal processing protease